MYTIDEIYGLAVQIEKNGETFYREGLKKISSPPVKAFLERLADDEREHVETFTRMREALATDPSPAEDQATSALLNILGDQGFSLSETDFTDIGSEELIQAALEFEKDTILFYELLRSLAHDSAAMKELNAIIEEEKRHISLLEEVRDGKGAVPER